MSSVIKVDKIQSDTGTVNVASKIEFPAGTVSAPSIFPTGDTNTGIFFPAADTIAFAEGGAEIMRVASTGRVGIGTTSPASTLEVSATSTNGLVRLGQLQFKNSDGSYSSNSDGVFMFPFSDGIFYHDNFDGGFAWRTGAAVERMRIDSSGNLLIGTTTAEGRATIRGSTSDATAFTFSTEAQDGTDQLRVRCDGAVYMGLDGSSPYNLTNGAAANAVLLSDGYLYRSTSSLRYKRDIEDLTHGLAKVLELRPVTYKGISPSDSENVYSGFIAEEVHAAGLTEFVQYDNEGQPDALHYGNMVALMAKAIQELSAKNDALEVRIAALEGAQT